MLVNGENGEKKLKSQINVYMCSTLVTNMQHYYNPNNNAIIIIIIIISGSISENIALHVYKNVNRVWLEGDILDH